MRAQHIAPAWACNTACWWACICKICGRSIWICCHGSANHSSTILNSLFCHQALPTCWLHSRDKHIFVTLLNSSSICCCEEACQKYGSDHCFFRLSPVHEREGRQTTLWALGP